jgi:hypothetical protein
MKKYIISLALVMLSISGGNACEICGCSMGSNYFGILPQFDKHFVGLRWTQSSFYAQMDHQSAYLEEEYSLDTYQTYELWSRLYLSERLQLFVSLPFKYNQMQGSHQQVTSAGVGDISILANYALVNTGEDVGNPWRHTWLVGGGLKLPTGAFRKEDQGLLINPNFQLGTGSTDFVFNTIYTLRYQNVGINMATTGQFNTQNPEGYRFGNQWNASAQLFYWRKMKYLSILPNAGMYYEAGEMHNANNIWQLNTGGEIWMAQAGLDVYYRDFAVSFTHKNPVSQRMNTDAIAHVEARDRIMISMIYNF